MDYRNTETGERVTEDALWERYREALDELGDVTIGGLQYAQSVALERVDPIAFRVGFNDWTDADGWEEV